MNKLKEILAKVLEVNPDQITLQTSPDSVETWDSYSGLLMVTELEDGYRVKFTMAEVRSVKSVKDIVAILRTRGIDIQE